MASQEEIRAEYQRLEEKIADARGEIEIARAMQKVNRVKCKHPNAYTYSAMGELGRKCPDCGYQT
jgi:hypothetical protein